MGLELVDFFYYESKFIGRGGGRTGAGDRVSKLFYKETKSGKKKTKNNFFFGGGGGRLGWGWS